MLPFLIFLLQVFRVASNADTVPLSSIGVVRVEIIINDTNDNDPVILNPPTAPVILHEVSYARRESHQ